MSFSQQNKCVPMHKQINQLIDEHENKILSLMPESATASAYARIKMSITNAIKSEDKFNYCGEGSIFNAAVLAFRHCVEVNTGSGYAYLTANTRSQKAKFELSYKGHILLAKRSSTVTSIYADYICAHDKYHIERGINQDFKHSFEIVNRGEIIAHYACIKFSNGEFDFEIMNKEEIDKVKNCSKAQNAAPWTVWRGQMGKKAVLKRLLIRIVIDDATVNLAIEHDTALELGKELNEGLIVESSDKRLPGTNYKPVKIDLGKSRTKQIQRNDNLEFYLTKNGLITEKDIINFLVEEGKITPDVTLKDLNSNQNYKNLKEEIIESSKQILNTILDRTSQIAG